MMRGMNALHIHVQVTVPALQGRYHHSSTAFNVSPGLTEVVLFGGCPEWPSDVRTAADLPLIANTTVLRFGEYTSCVLYTSHVWLASISISCPDHTALEVEILSQLVTVHNGLYNNVHFYLWIHIPRLSRLFVRQ